MAKNFVPIDLNVYATQFLFREDMIWRGMTAAGDKTVKDPIAYLNRMVHKYGEVVKEAAGLAYQYLPDNCLAECQRLIDETLSAKYGWKTCASWRAEGLLKFIRS